ncbi:MAG TPA: BlaI/MecI/CopY family transcriptional regulator [Gemmatimonadaceae bacterium]|nr:BlaI/MecI/CopY family transcriptional regulator [Gemmatimonadaceae bacterium]
MENLAPRERQIMTIIYRLGRATASEVQAELPDPLSNSAVRGMLRLLEEKGHLVHDLEGPRYVYRPSVDPARVSRTAVKDLVKTFFNNSAGTAVTAMLGMYEGRLKDEDLDRLEKAIEQARKRGAAK